MRIVNWPDLTIACAGESKRMSEPTLMGLPKEIHEKIVGVDDPKCLGNRVLYNFRRLNKECAQKYREKVHEFALMRLEKVVENDRAEADYFEWYATEHMNETWGEEGLITYEEAYCELIKDSVKFFKRIKSQYEHALKEKKFRSCRLILERYGFNMMKKHMKFKRLWPFNPAKIGTPDDVGAGNLQNPYFVRGWATSCAAAWELEKAGQPLDALPAHLFV